MYRVRVAVDHHKMNVQPQQPNDFKEFLFNVLLEFCCQNQRSVTEIVGGEFRS